MKRLSSFLLLPMGLFAASLFLNACQKEGLSTTGDEINHPSTAVDRAAVFYTVSVYDGINPSHVVGVENATNNMVSDVTAYYIDHTGNTINLDNLKGICLTSWGQYFVTTGSPVNPNMGPSLYDNALFKINPLTGQCSYLSTNLLHTVSDLEFDPTSHNFYGLLDNSNAIIEISNANNNNYGDYSAPAAITGIADDYTLKGLSLVSDANGLYFVGCASSVTQGEAAKLYIVPVGGGAATFLSNIDELGGWVGGHCGIGFDLQYHVMNINRNAWIVTAGLNYFK
ncbi:MAG: hypothetical protein H7246_16130, partial [Phycisphaerae bacterium]|nr:hypothetical protein [Saprospiraceae bacterium]